MPESEGSGLERIKHIVVLMLENRSFDREPDPGIVMGYYNATDLAVHDQQAARDEVHPAGRP